MTPADSQAILDEHFAPWIHDLNISVQEVTPDFTVTRMPLSDRLARIGGIVCGQALAALADTSMVLATVANAGEFKLFATTNLDTQFLRPGVGSAILCRAIIVRSGRALVFARAEMSEETSGKLVATATATFFVT